jgi:hypothetical protein
MVAGVLAAVTGITSSLSRTLAMLSGNHSDTICDITAFENYGLPDEAIRTLSQTFGHIHGNPRYTTLNRTTYLSTFTAVISHRITP